MSWFGAARRSPIGLDAQGRFINAVQLRGSSRRWRIEAAASVGRVDPSMPLEAEELARLTTMLHRQGFQGRDVVLAVPSERLLTGELEVPIGATAGVRLAKARAGLASVHKCLPQDLESDCWDIPKAARAKGKSSIIAVACKHAEANDLIDLFEMAGLTVRALDVESWAAARASAPVVGDRGDLVPILNLGWTAAVLVVVHDGVVVYERTLTEHGMNRLHGRLIAKLDMDNEVADHLLHEIGLRADAAGAEEGSELLAVVRSYITNHLDRLIAELNTSLSYAGQEYPDRELDRLLVHGEGAMVPKLVERLGEQLGLATRAIIPTDVARCGRSLAGLGGSPALVTALGLAQHRDAA